MGRQRVCGKICHDALGSKCGCWCGGLFHGTGGGEARDAFIREVGGPPKGEASEDARQPVRDAFARGIAAAKAAPRVGPPERDALKRGT